MPAGGRGAVARTSRRNDRIPANRVDRDRADKRTGTLDSTARTSSRQDQAAAAQLFNVMLINEIADALDTLDGAVSRPPTIRTSTVLRGAGCQIRHFVMASTSFPAALS